MGTFRNFLIEQAANDDQPLHKRIGMTDAGLKRARAHMDGWHHGANNKRVHRDYKYGDEERKEYAKGYSKGAAYREQSIQNYRNPKHILSYEHHHHQGIADGVNGKPPASDDKSYLKGHRLGKRSHKSGIVTMRDSSDGGTYSSDDHAEHVSSMFKAAGVKHTIVSHGHDDHPMKGNWVKVKLK